MEVLQHEPDNIRKYADAGDDQRPSKQSIEAQRMVLSRIHKAERSIGTASETEIPAVDGRDAFIHRDAYQKYKPAYRRNVMKTKVNSSVALYRPSAQQIVTVTGTASYLPLKNVVVPRKSSSGPLTFIVES